MSQRALILAVLMTLLPDAWAAPSAGTFCTTPPEHTVGPDFSPLVPLGPPEQEPGEAAWTWVNLWATWCAPCVAELPLLQALRAVLGPERMRLMLVSVDETREAPEVHLARHGLDGVWFAPPGAARSRVIRSLGLLGGALPVQVLIDPLGRVRCVHEGAITATDLPAIRRYFDYP